MTDINKIIVTKSSVHNLKDVSVEIPKNKITVITGPSGSGKSSLAFDTIYIEGQRRYIESLSSYARQFLGQYQPPEVESITGLSPAIAIDQKSTSRNPRSTVGTITEIYDYIRVLFARIGKTYDPDTKEEIFKYTVSQIVRELQSLPVKTKVQFLCPIKPEQYEINKFASMGFSKIRINDEISPFDSNIKINKDSKYEIIIDRVLIKEGIKKRLYESVESALKLGSGTVHVLIDDQMKVYSEHCNTNSGEVFPDLQPNLFSFNSPIGACSHCNGLGQSKVFTKELSIADDSLPPTKGAISLLLKRNNFIANMTECFLKEEGISLDTPLKKLPKKIKDILWHGTDKKYKYSFVSDNSNFEFNKEYPGIIPWLNKKYRETSSERVKKSLEEYMDISHCQVCNGSRLNKFAMNTIIDGYNIHDLSSVSIKKCFAIIEHLKLSNEEQEIAERLLKEITTRLNFLIKVGLDYLSLSRSASTLSGGESQRIRLATQIGSGLSGVLYVLDEPSIGLHQSDNNKLISTLKNLCRLGNTLVVVEHDLDTMLASDFIIDMGPGAGIHGGEVIEAGETKSILKSKKSLTASYLNGSNVIEFSKERRKLNRYIEVNNVNCNNISQMSTKLYLDGLVCITGVSGSGKSSLIQGIVVPACKKEVSPNSIVNFAGTYDSIVGINQIKTIIELDQSPIGKTPHSNPATYTGLFDAVRALYAKTPESQIRGYKAGRFSFNVKGGRCEECEGNGSKKIEMHFLPDVFVTCSECNGTRYNDETLSVLYKGKNISDVLQMSVDEAFLFFKNHKKMNRILATLQSVGLGYLKLGQPANTLSGGEAQRLKLSKELAKTTKGHTLYVLDEPTTGLHFKDVEILLTALNNLVNQGNSVIVIEHNLDVIKSADYIIDMGPGGGDKGGAIVAEGTPETIAKSKKSLTGKYLKAYLF